MPEASTRLSVRVAPGARTDALLGRHGDAWKVRVAAAPERGAANEAVVRLLAGALEVSHRDVKIVSGHGARDKIVELTGIAPAEAESRLARAGRREG